MNGRVTTFLPEKRYGFIRGDDGKDYFFHSSSFTDKTPPERVCEQAIVRFDPTANPKGYRAVNLSLVDSSPTMKFVFPDVFMTSRSNHIRGWETLEYGWWVVHGSSKQSPEAAKQAVIDRAKQIGANAVIDLTYYKTTGASGNYRYTIHNFYGRVVFVGKKRADGQARNTSSSINAQARLFKQASLSKFHIAKRRRNIAAVLGLVAATLLLSIATIAIPGFRVREAALYAVAALGFLFLLLSPREQGTWLVAT